MDSASFPANHARSVRARTMQMFWYSYFEKGCRTKWALDNPEWQYGIWLILGSWHCSCGTYIYCFPLALADIRPWPFVPFFQISLRTVNSKPPTIPFGIVAGTFSEKRSRKSFMQIKYPAGYFTRIPSFAYCYILFSIVIPINKTPLCFFSVQAMNTTSSPLGRKFWWW